MGWAKRSNPPRILTIVNRARHIAQNLVMHSAAARAFARRFHRTSSDGSADSVQATYAFYAERVDVQDKRVLELGPGKTLNVLELALQHGARSAAALDVTRYYKDAEAAARSVDYIVYDGGRMPFADGSQDVVWCSSVFEHLHEPALTVREILRVLDDDGTLVIRVDLRDHYQLGDERKWLECLRYSDLMWAAMTSHRTSYVNRLRYSQWLALFEEAGFHTARLEPFANKVMSQHYRDTAFVSHLSDSDLETIHFAAVLHKTGSAA